MVFSGFNSTFRRTITVGAATPAFLVGAVLPATANTGGVSPAGTAASANDVEFVALGNSFSAGGGAGDYTDLKCHRSANAYPAKWAEANKPTVFKFLACGGARMTQVRLRQLPGVTASTTLISLGIGGNDSKATLAMLICKDSTDNECVSALEDSESYILNQLPRELDLLFADIKKRAPKAKVVVVGYPYLYKEGGTCAEMSLMRRMWVRRTTDVLADTTAARTRAAGFTFLDTRPVFAGHEACTTVPWIDSWSHHPNAKGQIDGFLPAFSAAVAGTQAPR